VGKVAATSDGSAGAEPLDGDSTQLATVVGVLAGRGGRVGANSNNEQSAEPQGSFLEGASKFPAPLDILVFGSRIAETGTLANPGTAESVAL
jgi:hypothetical protein